MIDVGRNAYEQYLPIAIGIVENETRDFWSWFVKLLLDDIGCDSRWCFISDQQKVCVMVHFL